MIYDKAEDEKAVRITVKTIHDKTGATKLVQEKEEQTDEQVIFKRETSFYVKPELRVPKQEDTSAAVAEKKTRARQPTAPQ